MNLFLLAAGEGTRLQPYTTILPKPAIPFCGIPLIHYSAFLARELKPNRVIINTFHLPKEIHRVGKALQLENREIHFSDEQPLLLGAGGGFAKAQKLLESEKGFLAMNADEVIIPKQLNMMTEFYRYAKESTNLSTLLVMKHPEAGKKLSAVWVNAKKEVKGFGKVAPESHEELTPYHFIGPMYFKNKIFSYLKVEPSNILHDNLKQAIAMGEAVGIFPIECEWYETGNLLDYHEATKKFLNLLDSNVSFINKWKQEFLTDWLFVKTPQAVILMHHSAMIDSLSNVEGFAVLGANCKIAANVYLKNIVCAEDIILTGPKTYSNDLLLTPIKD